MIYDPRFIRSCDAAELVNLYHLARTALASKPLPEQGKGQRRWWAAEAFHSEHPDVSVMGAYKDLEGLLS